MKRNNKGFSLVELLVSFAVLAVVTVMISMMMTSGSNLFTRNKNVIDLQYKSQVATAQLYDYFKVCNGGIAYDNTSDTIAGIQKLSDTSGKMYVFKLDATEHVLYMYEIDISVEEVEGGGLSYDPSVINLNSFEAQPMCSYVDSIDVDVKFDYIGDSDTEKLGKAMVLSLNLKAGSSSYSKKMIEGFKGKPVYVSLANPGLNIFDTLKTKVWG